MFPNEVMMQPQTWNDILAAMVAVREVHGWSNGESKETEVKQAPIKVAGQRKKAKPASKRSAQPKARAKPAKKSARKPAKTKMKRAVKKASKAKKKVTKRGKRRK